MTLPWWRRGLPEPPPPPPPPPKQPITPFPSVPRGWAPSIVQGPIGEVNPYPLRVRLGVSVLSINPKMTWKPDGSGGWKSTYHMPWEVPDKQLGYLPTYWEDPHRLAAAFDTLRATPIGQKPPDWMDAPRLREAYDYMKYANRGAPPGEWRFLNANDPARSSFQSIAMPPAELLTPKDIIKYTPPESMAQDLMGPAQPGTPEWKAMPWWNKALTTIFAFGGVMPPIETRLAESARWRKLKADSTPEEWAEIISTRSHIAAGLTGLGTGLTMGAGTIGAVAAGGLVVGGPAGALAAGLGAVPAGALMAITGFAQGLGRSITQEKMAEYPDKSYYSYLDQALYHVGSFLDIGAQFFEKTPGSLAQIGFSVIDPDSYGPVSELLDNKAATWNAGGVAYETQPLVQGAINLYGDTWSDAVRALGMSEEDIKANQRNLPFYGARPGKSLWELGHAEPTLLPPELQTQNGWEAFGKGLQEARYLMLSGEYTTEEATMIVAQEYGFTGQFADFIGHVVLDPLNSVVGDGGTRAIRALGQQVGNARLVEAADISTRLGKTGITNTLRVYGNYLRTMVPPDEVSAMGPISRILGGVNAQGESTLIPGVRLTMEGEAAPAQARRVDSPYGEHYRQDWQAQTGKGQGIRLHHPTGKKWPEVQAEIRHWVLTELQDGDVIQLTDGTKLRARVVVREGRHSVEFINVDTKPGEDGNMGWFFSVQKDGSETANMGEASLPGARVVQQPAPTAAPVVQTAPAKPVRGAWAMAAAQRVFGLTPRARAFEALGNASENMRGLLQMNATVEEVNQAWTQLLAINRRQVLEESFKMLNSPDGMLFVQMLKDFGDAETPLYKAWLQTTPQRQLLLDLAKFMGVSTQEFVRLLKNQGPEGTWRAVQAKMAQTADPAMLQKVETWRLSQDHIAKLTDLYVKDGVPWSPEEWKAALYSAWIDHSAKWIIDKIGVKVEPMVWRLSDTMKGVYSLGLLDVNAAYAIANGLNNFATSAVDGNFRPGLLFEYQQWWKDFGVPPFRLAQAYGGAAGLGDDVGGIAHAAKMDADALRLITSAAKGKGGLTVAENVIGSLRRKVGFATKVSAALERMSSIMVTTAGTKDWWAKTWHRGQAMRRMPAALENLLGPELSDMVYGLAEGSINQAKLEEAFSRRAASRPLESYLGDVARDLGKTPGEVRSMLESAGALDYLNDKLPKAKTPDDVRRIFAEFEAQKQADIAELSRKDGEARAGEAAAQLQTGDLFGFLDGWYSNNRRRGQWWTQHTLGMAEMMREVAEVGDTTVRRTIIAARMAAHRAEWTRVNQAEADMYQGMVDGLRNLGFEVPAAVMESQAGQVRARNLFFDARDATWRDFFETDWGKNWKARQARYLEILQELDNKYGALAMEDVRFQEALDEATVSIIRSKNPEAADVASVLLTELRDRLTQTYAEEQTVRRLAYQLHTVQRATGPALVAEIKNKLAVMPDLLARITPLLEQMMGTTGELGIGSVYANIYRAYLEGAKLPSIAEYHNIRNVGVGQVFGLRAAPMSAAEIIQGRLPMEAPRAEQPGVLPPGPAGPEAPRLPEAPPDLNALRLAASNAGIATMSDGGQPINAHLVNWINSPDGLRLRAIGAPIKRLQDLAPEQIPNAIARLGERSAHFAELEARQKQTGVTVEAQRALEKWDAPDGPGLVKARRMAVQSGLDQGTADLLPREDVREWLQSRSEGRPYPKALPATVETLRAFIEKATGGDQAKVNETSRLVEAYARSEGVTVEEYLARHFGQDDPEATLAYYQAKGELHPWAQRMLDHFGTTRNPKEGGFILPDGRMLDLSGRAVAVGYERNADGNYVPEQGKPDYLRDGRNVDHHEAAQFRDDGNADATDLDHFLAVTGAIRVSLFGERGQEMYMVQANSVPTDAQMRTIYDVMNRYPGAVLSWDVVDPKSGRAVALGSGPIREEVVAFEEGARTNGQTYMQQADDPGFKTWIEPSAAKLPDGRPQILYVPGGGIVPLVDSGSAATRYGPGIYAFGDPKRAMGDVRPIERVVRFDTQEQALAAKPISAVHQDPLSGKWVATIRDYELIGSGAASPVPLRRVGLAERGRYLSAVVDTETFRTMQARLSDAERGLLRQTLQRFVNGGWLPDLVKLEGAPYRLTVTEALIRSGMEAAGQNTPVYLRVTKPADMTAPITDAPKLAEAVIARLGLTDRAAEAAREAITGTLGQRSLEAALNAVPGLTAARYGEVLQAAGYDGIRFLDANKNVGFMAWDPSQLRSAFRPDVSAAEGTTFFQDGVPPKAMQGMYLLGQQVTSARMKQPMAPADFRSWLRGKGVKEDELHWSGMDDWLNDVAQTPGARVTPEMARAFYEANPFRVDVTEYPGVYLGEHANSKAYGSKRAWLETGTRAEGGRVWEPDAQRGYDEYIVERPGAIDAYFGYHGPNQYTSSGVLDFATLEDAKAYADLGTFRRVEGTKWGKYQTGNGGKNYTELVISLPQQRRPISYEQWLDAQNSYRSPDIMGDQAALMEDLPQNRAIYDEFLRRRDPGVLRQVGPRISSRHSHEFPQDNIMAWVRGSEWRTADGERVFLIDEMQSDIHNRGRRFGYKSPEDQAKLAAAVEAMTTTDRRFAARRDEWERTWRATFGDNREQRLAFDRRHGDHWRDVIDLNIAIDQAAAAGLPPRGNTAHHDYEPLAQWEIDSARALRKIAQETRLAWVEMKDAGIAYDRLAHILESKVEDVPWKDTYHELAMKHMTRWAATHGFDRLAWTTGLEQTKRWSAWQVADVLTWARNADSDTYDVIAYKDNGVVHQLGQATLDEISDTYGPGIADMIAKEMGKMELPRIGRVPINLGGEYIVEYAGARKKFSTYEEAQSYALKLVGDQHPVMLNHTQGLGSQYDLGGRLFEQDLQLPSRGFASFYDEKLPGWARKTAGKFKGTVEDVDLHYAIGDDASGYERPQVTIGMNVVDGQEEWRLYMPDSEGGYDSYEETFPSKGLALMKQAQLQSDLDAMPAARVHSLQITSDLQNSVLTEGQTYFQHPVGEIMRRNLAESEQALTAEIRRTYPDYTDASVTELVDAIRTGRNTLDVVGVGGSLAWAESALPWRSQEYGRWFDLVGLLDKLGREPTFEDLKKLAVGDRRYGMVERGIPGEGSYKLYQAEGALSGYAEVRTNFPEADFWIVRKGTKDTVGTVTKTFSPEHIGVKITATGELDPNYLYYAMQYVQGQGYFKQRAHGTTSLQNITVRDVQEVRFGGRRTMYQVGERADGRFTVDYKGIPFLEVKDRATAELLMRHFEQDGLAAGSKPKGSATLTAENTWILRALEAPDFTTVVHELGHSLISRVAANPEWSKPVLDWMKNETTFEDLDFINGRLVGQDEHVRAGHELLANAYVRYHHEGIAPSLTLRTVFENIKRWLTEIYREIKGSAIDVNMTAEVRKVFDELLSTSEERGQLAEYNAKQRPAQVEERPVPSVLPEGVTEQGTARLNPADGQAGAMARLRGDYLRSHLNRTVSNELMKLSGHRDATGRPITRAEYVELMAARGQGYVNMGKGRFGWFPTDMRPLEAGNTLRQYFDFLREQSGVKLISGLDESIRDNLLEVDRLMGQPVPDMQTVNGREVWAKRAADIKDATERVEELLQSKGETMATADLDAYRRVGRGVEETAIITPANAPRPMPDTPDAIFGELNQLQDKLLGGGAPNRADSDRFVKIMESIEPKKSMSPLEWETAFQVWLLLEPENGRNLAPEIQAQRLNSLKARFLANKPTGASLDLTSWQRQMADVQAAIRAAQPQVDIFKGSIRKAHGPDPNEQFNLRYAVVPLDQVVSSTRLDGSNNPDYPQQYQPRARDRAAYQLEAEGRAAELNIKHLLDHSERIDDASPVVDSGNVVLSGNGRMQSLLIAREKNPTAFTNYQAELKANLPAYGISTEAMDAAAEGGYVLVRILEEPGVNRQQFAALANAPSSTSMSPSERATADAKLISDGAVIGLRVPETSTIEEALGRVENADFTRSFLQAMPEAERASMATTNGQLNGAGASRIVAALFARVFPGEAGRRMLDRVFESMDNNVKRVSSGIKNALPSLARLEQLVASGERPADYGIAVDLAASADALARIRSEGMNPTSWLQQGQMFGSGLTPFQESLLLDLGQVDSSKAVRTWLENYAVLVEKQPSTKQTGMFGAYEYPPRDQLWVKAKANEELTLFQLPEGTPITTPETVPPVLPNGALAQEAWENVRPTLDALKGKLSGQDGWANEKEINLDRRLTGEDKRLFGEWIRGVKQDMAANKMAAIRWGEVQRDTDLLNYNQRRGYSGAANLAMPYFFWPTETALRWAMRAIDRPSLIANYYRFRKLQEMQEEIPGFPSRLRGKVPIYLPFLPDWMQDTVWIDPLAQMFPPIMFEKRFSYLVQNEARADANVRAMIDQMTRAGTISLTDAQQAKQSGSGSVWEQAKTAADAESGSDRADPLDLVNVLTGFAPPVEWARQYINGTPENIGPLPVTRQVKTITHALNIGPPGGVNLEAGIRRQLGLPSWDRFENYREDRALASMIAEGKITLDESQRGMLQRSGPAFDEARRRVEDVRLYGGFLNPLYWAGFPGDAMPAGEERQRVLSLEWQNASDAWRAGDEDARDAFLDKYPEYEARLMSLNMNPTERLRSYLIDEIWTRYRTFGRTDKQMVVQQLGRAFEQLFLDKETRNYAGVDTESLAMWARALGMWVPETKDTTWDMPTAMSAPEVKLLPPDLSAAVDAFKNQRDEKFPMWYGLQTRYYQLPPGAQRRAFLSRFPQLKSYWDWKDKQYAAHPEVKQFIQGLEVSAGDTQVGLLSMPEVLTNELLMEQLFGATYAGQPLSSGALEELLRVWESNGQPGGSLQAWLQTSGIGLTAP